MSKSKNTEKVERHLMTAGARSDPGQVVDPLQSSKHDEKGPVIGLASSLELYHFRLCFFHIFKSETYSSVLEKVA